MKYLIAIVLLVSGIAIGYFWGKSSFTESEQELALNDEPFTEVIRDTIIKKETVKIPVADGSSDSLLAAIDSLSLAFDSLMTEVQHDDSLQQEEIGINREKLLKTLKLPITYLQEEIEKDTAIKELLGIDESKPTHIFVEFWQSPLNYEGYKLSRSKLVLYGLSTQFSYKFYKKSDRFYLAYQDIYYLMRETQDFLPYLQVEKKDVFD